MSKVAINGKLRERIIEEARSSRPAPPNEDEITAAILAKELECSHKTAQILLNTMVNEGKATMRKNGPSGCKVYRYTENQV